ncbi:Agamous-like MADS-box protein AGL62, partial [Glycine soja]
IIKNTKGRQKKIEIKKMSNKRNLQVTFSKRRTGIFKKASELTTLCGMNLAVIMSSPGNRVFSFGSPSVDSVIQHYTAQGPPPLLNLELNEASIDEHELHVHLNNLSDQIAAEKKHKKDLNRMLNAAEEHVWFVMPIKSMNDAQLETYKKMLEELKTYANEKREKLLQRLPNTSMGVATLTHDFRF